MKTLPTLFVSHGAPTLSIEDIPAREFLKGLGSRYPEVSAVLCISAHWNTKNPEVTAVEKPETIHDFYGFPEELYTIKYPVKGEPELAERTADLINKAGFSCDIDGQRGLDHGAWVPTRLMYPKADVPVVQLSIQSHLDPKRHYLLGKAIEELNHEGVLILGSGGAVHPLGYAPLGPGARTDDWAMDFDKWLTDAVTRGDVEQLENYSQLAPYPQRAHPYPDHFMPLLVALGAAGSGARGKIIHHSWYWGDLGMAAYEFNSDKK
ncbi:DODA-type extradiol aromatic ring-opening family dioxygenase [Methanobacterium paludis]|uniref:Extradiol ring-cleavage dioxygenase class III protein subunit B n=1 Tax=Methanobacterium paludis (strain DSM 25820 / JCM 18151 / SWAN1) TaxID=868131 RepID=F6D5Z6_METPW|nr:class III extradiol ring-cleavage dioxygenase [Methanobacterium paludis]AEG19366.1 Extradiol ring-cleavage dioxygenase class III protein subunit B [Methanobacterium paludis]